MPKHEISKFASFTCISTALQTQDSCKQQIHLFDNLVIYLHTFPCLLLSSLFLASCYVFPFCARIDDSTFAALTDKCNKKYTLHTCTHFLLQYFFICAAFDSCKFTYFIANFQSLELKFLYRMWLCPYNHNKRKVSANTPRFQPKSHVGKCNKWCLLLI